MYNPDSPFQEPQDFMNRQVRTPRGTGVVRHYRGIYVYVVIDGVSIRTHWAHCTVV